MFPIGKDPTVQSDGSVGSAKPPSKTQATPPTQHQLDKQTNLNLFSTKLKNEPLADCQNLLRQAIYGSRGQEVFTDDARIRSLQDPKELTSRKFPKSAALAVVACVYQAFGARILTGGQIDKEKLTGGLYMMFGKEMPQIQSDVLGILDGNFSIDVNTGTLSAGPYSIEVEMAKNVDFNTLVNVNCTDPTYFYNKPQELLIDFFGGALKIPQVLQNISSLTAQKFKLPTTATVLDVLQERSQNMKKGSEISHVVTDSETADGTKVKVESHISYFVDSNPSFFNKLMKKYQAIIAERARRDDPAQAIATMKRCYNKIQKDQTTWIKAAPYYDVLEALIEHGDDWLKKTKSTDQLLAIAKNLAEITNDPFVESSAASTINHLIKKAVNCWCKTTSISINDVEGASSTVVFVGTQAFQPAQDDRIAASKTILDEMVSRNVARIAEGPLEQQIAKTKMLVVDLRLLSPGADEGKLYAKHTLAMKQAAADINRNRTPLSSDNPTPSMTMTYLPIHCRAEGKWAAWASWARTVVNAILGQLTLLEGVEASPAFENDFMTSAEITAVKAQIQTAFGSMSVVNQKKYQPVLDQWNALLLKRDVQANTAVFATLTNILQDAVNNDPKSPYFVDLMIGCKSGIDRSTACPVVMDMLKPLILMELEKTGTQNTLGEPIVPDLN